MVRHLAFTNGAAGPATGHTAALSERGGPAVRQTFAQWLAEQVDRTDAVGDVARQVVALPTFDRAGGWGATRRRVEQAGRADLVDGLRDAAAERREGRSWEPFQPGHTAPLRHGAKSPRLVTPIAVELEAELRRVAPWVEGEAFAAEVRSWAWSEAQARVLRDYLDEHGLVDPEGKPRPAADLLRKVEGSAAKRREALGLTPMAMTRLLAGLSAVDPAGARGGLEALRATGRAIREAAEARALPAGEAP